MRVFDLGIATYKDALIVQNDLLHRRIEKKIPDSLIVVEHQPVVTLGRLTEEDAVIEKDYFTERGIPLLRTSRGGENTFHAPGQLVLYPVIDLKDKKEDISFYILLISFI